MRRKIGLCCALCFLLLALLGNLTYADSLTSHMEYTYAKALTLADRSTFDGYCGMCVGRQLQALGINTSYEGTNGNDLYDKYKAMTKTSGGYTVNCLPATSYTLSQALNYINSNNTSGGYTYVAIGFQIGFGSDGQKYGHTLLIYSVNNGTVYYTESSGTSIRTRSISSFCSYYSSCTFEGAVWFTNGTADTEAPIISDLRVEGVSGDSFTVKCTLNDNVGVTRVWLNVYGPGGSNGYSVSASNGNFSHTIYTANYGGTGVYAVHIYVFDAADNGSGMHAINEIYIINPEQPNLYIDKYVAAVNEDVTFSYDAKYTNQFWLQIFKDNIQMYSLNLGDSEKYTMSFQETGYYAAYISGSNELGYADSQWLYFTICGEKPSGANLSVNKSTASINESILFSFYAKYANEYWLQIFKKDKQVYSLNLGGSFQYEMSFAEEGSYSAYISCSNGLGYVDSDWIHFYITNENPKNAELTIDKTLVKPNEMVKFIFNAELANQYWLQIFKDDKQVYSINLGNENQHEMTFIDEGNYSAYVSCSNGLGYVDSKWVYFSVSNSFYRVPYTSSTITKNNTLHLIQTSLYNIDTSCIVLAAGYKGDNLVTLAIKGYEQEDLSIPLDGDFDTIKVMIWDSGTSMQDLCEAEVIPSSEWKIE